MTEAVEPLEKSPESSRDHRQLAYAYILLRDLPAAESHLQAAAETDRRLLLELARLHGVQGRTSQAEAIARDALSEFSTLLQTAPENETLRLYAADAAFLLRRYAEATEVLEQGRITGPRPLLDRALARTLIVWYDALGAHDRAKPLQPVLQLLERSHAADPWNLPTVERLEALRLKERTTDQSAEGLMASWLANNHPPPGILGFLGVKALIAGDWERARQLLQRSYAADPSHPETANHLAWVLASSSPPDLPEAWRIINQALGSMRNTDGTDVRRTMLVGTRGMIAAKMQR